MKNCVKFCIDSPGFEAVSSELVNITKRRLDPEHLTQNMLGVKKKTYKKEILGGDNYLFVVSFIDKDLVVLTDGCSSVCCAALKWREFQNRVNRLRRDKKNSMHEVSSKLNENGTPDVRSCIVMMLNQKKKSVTDRGMNKQTYSPDKFAVKS